MKKILSVLFFVLTSFYGHVHAQFDDSQYDLDIYMESDEGDFIGRGFTYHIKGKASPFCTNHGYNKCLSIHFNDWSFEFMAPNGEELKQGLYLNAQRYLFHTPENPGMRVAGDYRGCNRIAGEFNVIDIIYDESNRVTSLAIDFIQICEYGNKQLKGHIRYNSQVPVPNLRYPLSISMYSSKNEYIGQGSEKHYQKKIHCLHPVFECKTNVISLSAGGYDFDFVAPEGERLIVGEYYNATQLCFADNKPGIDISGNGRGCNKIEGNFQVMAIDYDDDGAITKLAIDFIQYCDDIKLKRPLTGSIRYNSNIPLTSNYWLLEKFGYKKDEVNFDFDFHYWHDYFEESFE
jgi:hypothetical protein